jgi:threonine dehydrogenase-like Zn-dependent dehydrogenase
MRANVTYEQAAPSTEGSHYALSHIRAAKIQSGQDVLVNGATGAIGSAAVQLLKSLGANVTGVCDTDNVELVRGLGADRVIDYTAEDFTKDEQTYDVVLDSVGKSSFSQCKRLRDAWHLQGSRPNLGVNDSGPGALQRDDPHSPGEPRARQQQSRTELVRGCCWVEALVPPVSADREDPRRCPIRW